MKVFENVIAGFGLFALAWSSGLTGPLVGQDSQNKFLMLQARVAYGSQWYYFWLDPKLGSSHSQNYRITCFAAHVGKEWIIIAKDLGLRIHCLSTEGQEVGRLTRVDRIIDLQRTNEQLIADYLAGSLPCFSGDDSRTAVGKHGVLPNARLQCSDPASFNITQRVGLSVALSKQVFEEFRPPWRHPDSSAEFINIARKIVSAEFPNTAMRIVVPRFSPDDPRIFLLVTMAKDADWRGVLPISVESDGRLYPEKVLVDSEKNNIGYLVSRIREYSEVEFTVP